MSEGMTDPTRDRTRLNEVATILFQHFPVQNLGDRPKVFEAADALIAAGLVVPEGMTAEKLREIASNLLSESWSFERYNELRGWADALGVPEAKTETPQ